MKFVKIIVKSVKEIEKLVLNVMMDTIFQMVTVFQLDKTALNLLMMEVVKNAIMDIDCWMVGVLIV